MQPFMGIKARAEGPSLQIIYCVCISVKITLNPSPAFGEAASLRQGGGSDDFQGAKKLFFYLFFFRDTLPGLNHCERIEQADCPVL
jgi:hypothetical protein